MFNKLNVVLKLVPFAKQYGFSELMQRIFKLGDIQNGSLAPNRAEHFDIYTLNHKKT